MKKIPSATVNTENVPIWGGAGGRQDHSCEVYKTQKVF